MNTDEQIKIAEHLQKYELGLSHLYATYARLFPEHREFWENLSVEENTHAFMLSTFKELIEKGDYSLTPRRFSLSAIENNMQKLSSFQNYAMKSGTSLKEALESAIEIETGIIENRTFDSHEDDPPEVKRILDALAEDTRRHAQTIKDLYRRLYG
ncbi:MAG: hypothetical protein R6V10_03690 [bacterium]